MADANNLTSASPTGGQTAYAFGAGGSLLAGLMVITGSIIVLSTARHTS
jgi:hypothetical protein